MLFFGAFAAALLVKFGQLYDARVLAEYFCLILTALFLWRFLAMARLLGYSNALLAVIFVFLLLPLVGIIVLAIVDRKIYNYIKELRSI